MDLEDEGILQERDHTVKRAILYFRHAFRSKRKKLINRREFY